EQEQESDIYAVDLMLRSGYDPQGLIELMQIFKENSSNFKLLEFTQTHPIPESRIEYLKQYIAEKESENTAADNKESSDQSLTMPEKNEYSDFENNQIRFSYPEGWDLKELDTLKKEVEFRYRLSSKALKAEIFLEDLSSKNFMETARKHFNYAAIEAEENGYQVDKRTIADKKLDIYQLELVGEEEFKLEYFISQKNQQQLLKFSFEIDEKNRIQQSKLIESVIESIEFK
ncbi:MAG: M48 family metalloprotease, partial [Halanaerobium sp.]